MNNELLRGYLRANCLGRRNEKSGRVLCSTLGMSDSELRRRIAGLRQDGVPIASTQSGYFYAVTAGEVYGTLRLLKGMAAGLERSIRGLEASLERFWEGEMDTG